jgi:hypothetical protein
VVAGTAVEHYTVLRVQVIVVWFGAGGGSVCGVGGRCGVLLLLGLVAVVWMCVVGVVVVSVVISVVFLLLAVVVLLLVVVVCVVVGVVFVAVFVGGVRRVVELKLFNLFVSSSSLLLSLV